MRRPPRGPAQPLFSASLAGWGLLQGVLALGVVGSTAVVGMWRDMPEDEVRALAFVSLVATNVGLILVNRTFGASLLSAQWGAGPMLWAVVGTAGTLLAVATSWPPAEALFRFGPLHTDDLAACLVGNLGVVAALELIKPIWRTRLSS